MTNQIRHRVKHAGIGWRAIQVDESRDPAHACR
jgi:hypothetical protein